MPIGERGKMSKTDNLIKELSHALRGVSESLSDTVLDAMMPFFEKMEAEERDESNREMAHERYDAFVNESDLTQEQKKHLRVYRRYVKTDSISGECALIMALLDKAIERIDDLEITVEALTDY